MKTLAQKKTAVDLLQGPILKSMLAFAVPILFSGIFQQFYNTMDTVIIGYTLGDEALAAMGAAGAIFELLSGFALGIGNGLAIVTARSFGSGDGEQLKRSVAASLVIGVVVTVLLTTAVRFILYPFLNVLHTPPEIIDEAYSYISTITLFIGVMFAYNLCAGLLRAIGNSVMPLVFLILSSLLNIVLDLLLIKQLHMGVRGAAVATVIAQAVSVFACLVYIGKRAGILIPQKKHFVRDKDLYLEMLAQGFAMAFMSSIVSAGSAILQSGINGLGYLVIAGHVAARKLFSFLMMPYIAVSQTLSTFVAQNYGAGQMERIRRAVKYSYLCGAVLTAGITLFTIPLAPMLVRLLSGSSETVVIENGALYLRVVAPCMIILTFLNPTRFALQSIGNKILPILSSVIELIGKYLFVVFLIPRFAYLAVIFCEPVIWAFMDVELLWAFWRNPKVRAGKAEEVKEREAARS
ncbi:MAG: MATE family efflux transporter [bacterium]|nr:MATE family efflux transporter [bacterium]MCM1423672.1 MATE family efflux transporter [bacterium]